MPHSLPHIIATIRASGRTTTHGAILLAEVDRLTAWLEMIAALYGEMGMLAQLALTGHVALPHWKNAPDTPIIANAGERSDV